MKNKAKNKKRAVFLQSRRGVILVALIAVSVLVINLITASYSWFKPQPDEKGYMQYSFVGKMRSESCTMTTFKGTKLTKDVPTTNPAYPQQGEYINQIRYEAITENMSSYPITAGQPNYFKTEIINSDPNNPSDISLFIKSLPAGTLAVTFPGNSVRTFSSNKTDCYIVRDAYVKKYVATDVNGPGKLVIEWFITPTSATSINLNGLYILYN